MAENSAQEVFSLDGSRWMCGTCGAIWNKSEEPGHRLWCWSPEALETAAAASEVSGPPGGENQ